MSCFAHPKYITFLPWPSLSPIVPRTNGTDFIVTSIFMWKRRQCLKPTFWCFILIFLLWSPIESSFPRNEASCCSRTLLWSFTQFGSSIWQETLQAVLLSLTRGYGSDMNSCVFTGTSVVSPEKVSHSLTIIFLRWSWSSIQVVQKYSFWPFETLIEFDMMSSAQAT